MNIPTVVIDILKVAAPTLLTALGGPLAGAAATVATSALEQWLLPGRTALQTTPAQIIATVQAKADDPKFLLDLRRAELDLQRYEGDLEFRFADLVVKDKQSSRDFQAATDIARPLMRWGMGIVVIAIVSLLSVVLGSVLMVSGAIRLPPESAQLAVGVFGLIGAITGYIASYGTQVLGFYFGSSVGSKAKDEALSDALATSGVRLGEAIAVSPVSRETLKPVPVAPPQVIVVPQQPTPTPTPFSVPVVADWKQSPFGGARWQVLPDGVLVEGDAKVARTVGEPVTVRKVWANYGPMILAECTRLRVPVEIAVMVLCTESAGAAAATLKEPDGRVSSGLMQVLPATAADVLKRSVSVEELKDPAISLAAGIGYILQQKPKTWFDPILTAASYNAGGLYEARSQDKNRFNLRSTGDHLERAIRWYGDICFVSRVDNWFKIVS